MQKLNWTITYPPTEEMQDMNIDTPYEDEIKEQKIQP